jgi:hypothetical protein
LLALRALAPPQPPFASPRARPSLAELQAAAGEGRGLGGCGAAAVLAALEDEEAELAAADALHCIVDDVAASAAGEPRAPAPSAARRLCQWLLWLRLHARAE